MSDNVQSHMPAFNLNRAARNFLLMIGRTIGIFNPHQAGLHTATQCMQLAIKLEAVMDGCINVGDRASLKMMSDMLRYHAAIFESGLHTGDVLRGDRVKMLHADIELAHASISAGHSISHNFDGACQEAVRANMGLVRVQDKIVPPVGWKAADLSPFIDLATE